MIVHAAQVDIAQNFSWGWLTSFGQLIDTLVTPAFSIAGIAVVFYFVYGCFRWILSGGDKEGIMAARKMMIHAIVGFFILIFMFLLIQYIPQALGLKGYTVINSGNP